MDFEIETKRFSQAARIISNVATREAFPNDACANSSNGKRNYFYCY